MARDADSPGRESTSHARTDRQSAGGSVDVTPETLYLTKIAVQQARIDALETAVERQERDLQQVIDRYERLLTARTQTGKPLADGGRDGDDTPDAPSEGFVGRILSALRRLP